ncbi:MAG: hypothetical protein H0V47_14115 [Chloroflexia bacterium]|nr:hypothetical protein [Chloroflexia bacterium]
MSWESILLWGFVATIVLTSIMVAAQQLHLTRMSLPLMLGTMLTPNRDRAPLVGFSFHLMNGWIFALLYAMAFESWDRATWWLGASIGLVHSMFVLLVGMQMLPSLHPRMASEQHGPSPTRQLQPPGVAALNYGRRTPIATIAAHLVYGAILGAFYTLS